MKVEAWIAAAGLVALAAFGAERALRGPDGEAPAVERLLAPEQLAGRTPAAFTLESGGRELSYLRSKGVWRCREAFGAVCATDEVESVVAALTNARGSVLGAGPAVAARAGLDAPLGLRVSLHGAKFLSDPSGDVLARIAYGPPANGATFASSDAGARVLAVDLDPRAFLEASGRPAPLVDTRVLAGSLATGFAGFERMFVDAGAASIELQSSPPEAPGGERSWRLVHDGRSEDALLWRVGGYVSLWVRLRYEAPDDPREVEAFGFARPRARITLAPNVGDAIEVLVSEPDASNVVRLWNRSTNVVARVRADLLPLLVPTAPMFTRLEGGNPWEAWLAPR